MTKVLYTSEAVRKKIIEIMDDNSYMRTIVVAFVGESAEHYLGNPKGIKIICWPKPGSTNPYELNRLIKKGAEIYFCNNLHMKIFHSEEHGTVIGSANLTKNAIGGGNLLEAGIFLSKGEFDINKITNQFKIRKPLKKDWNELYKGFEKNIILEKSKKFTPANDFLDWFNLPIEHKIKISIYDGWDDFCEEELEYGPEYAIPGLKKYYKTEDWLLTINMKKGILIPQSTEWQYVDRIISIKGRDYPISALQDKPLKTYRLPFRLTPNFKKILAEECRIYGIKKLDVERNKYLSDSFLKRLAIKMRKSK